MPHSTIDNCRKDFPSLSKQYNGRPLIYLDGPAGSQIPQTVIDAMIGYYKSSNANTHGAFITSRDTDTVLARTRDKVAAYLGAESPNTISFGQNMTSLTYSLSRAIGRALNSGEEIIITALDHEANRGPWLALEDFGIVIREVRMQPNGTLDYRDLKEKVNPRTRLIALGYCSNALGTVNNVQMVRELADKVGAWLLLDAVHYAAHFPIDVQTIGCDFLLCSAYKFYGPHVGLLYSKPGLLDLLPIDRLRTQEQTAPYLIETGTLNHAALAGVSATIDYIASFGSGNSYREKIMDAMTTISSYEHGLGAKLYFGLSSMPGVKIQGLDFKNPHRAPTVSFFVEGMTAHQLCEKLSERSICAWDGHFYAIRTMEMLGLLEKEGVTRLGVLVYNTPEEIDYTISAIKEIIP